MKTVSVIKSNIKGYHSFKIRPCSDVDMIVDLENDNVYDPFAMAVTMPDLKDIHQKLHSKITKENKRKTKGTMCSRYCWETSWAGSSKPLQAFQKRFARQGGYQDSLLFHGYSSRK